MNAKVAHLRNLIHQSFHNDPAHQHKVERFERDAASAEHLLERWGVLPALPGWIKRCGESRETF